MTQPEPADPTIYVDNDASVLAQAGGLLTSRRKAPPATWTPTTRTRWSGGCWTPCRPAVTWSSRTRAEVARFTGGLEPVGPGATGVLGGYVAVARRP